MLEKEHLILCGGIDGSKRRSAPEPLTLKLGKEKGKGQICMDVDAITRKMVADLPAVLRDLLEVATYVYVADQSISRGGQRSFEYGNDHHRCLRFRIPVREYDLWSDPENRELLEETLSFASGDTYTFEFSRRRPDDFPGFLNLSAEAEPEHRYTEVVLFSGGLDSFTGAMDEVVGHRRLPVLVGHQSNNKLTGLQGKLHEYLVELRRPELGPLHVPVEINKDKRLTKETSQRTRSFLYAALGTIVARMFNLNRVKFYENGIVSCNLPFDGQALQARSTRSTHPRLLHLLSKLVSVLIDSDFQFENPYFNRSKTEVCLRLKELHQEKLIAATRSCARSIYRSPATHCGTCSQCIDRRFATLAAECGEHDPDFLYALDVFKDNIESTHDRTMAVGFVRFANDVGDMTPESFVRKFSSEVHEIARYVPGAENADMALKSLFLLHQRHSESVTNVMAQQIAKSSLPLVKATLSATCLVRMVGAGLHVTTGQKKKRSGAGKKHGKGELNEAVERLLRLHPAWDAVKIAKEVGNTTPAAVRKTKAWKQRPRQ